MNLRNVLKTYSLLRSLTDDESALLDTLRSMNDSERELLVESLGPVKAVKKATRKPATTRTYDHCLRCGTTKRDSSHKDQASPDYHEFQSSASKSSRAVSLAQQIKTTGSKPRPVVQSLCMTCDYDSDHNVHHLESVDGYHLFTPPVPSAAPQSSASNGAESSILSSEGETVSAQSAAGGSSD